MGDEPRSATIKITRDTKLLEIFREDFYQIMAGDPSIARGMFRVLK